ncbi:hypothetical protein [Actinomadura geliboluensis]|uniref:hypothetical protein n=1 Tax=Actinomadura geliboluensis TaxID=882440 RepID=UPI0036A9B0A8
MSEVTMAEELRQFADRLRTMIDAARADLTSSTYYAHDEANYTAGINNACGGAAAELAASYTPAHAERTVTWLEGCADDIEDATRIAHQWLGRTSSADVFEWCAEPTSARLALAYVRLQNGDT